MSTVQKLFHRVLPCQPGMFLLTSKQPGLAGLLAFALN